MLGYEDSMGAKGECGTCMGHEGSIDARNDILGHEDGVGA